VRRAFFLGLKHSLALAAHELLGANADVATEVFHNCFALWARTLFLLHAIVVMLVRLIVRHAFTLILENHRRRWTFVACQTVVCAQSVRLKALESGEGPLRAHPTLKTGNRIDHGSIRRVFRRDVRGEMIHRKHFSLANSTGRVLSGDMCV
jgi:hypothetical protein